MTSYIDSITVEDFKNYFTRQFPYAPADEPNNQEYITDADITVAFGQARINFPIKLFDEESGRVAFMFLVAHYLCMDMQMAQSGIASTGQYIITSKSVGDVSASYGVPNKFLTDPFLNYFSTTQFGMKYLSLLYPRTVGAVNVVLGGTTIR